MRRIPQSPHSVRCCAPPAVTRRPGALSPPAGSPPPAAESRGTAPRSDAGSPGFCRRCGAAPSRSIARRRSTGSVAPPRATGLRDDEPGAGKPPAAPHRRPPPTHRTPPRRLSPAPPGPAGRERRVWRGGSAVPPPPSPGPAPTPLPFLPPGSHRGGRRSQRPGQQQPQEGTEQPHRRPDPDSVPPPPPRRPPHASPLRRRRAMRARPAPPPLFHRRCPAPPPPASAPAPARSGRGEEQVPCPGGRGIDWVPGATGPPTFQLLELGSDPGSARHRGPSDTRRTGRRGAVGAGPAGSGPMGADRLRAGGRGRPGQTPPPTLNPEKLRGLFRAIFKPRCPEKLWLPEVGGSRCQRGTRSPWAAGLG